ncbi:MAG: response regulator, partial [Deltaproteobacteria bacterium]|nr:response regulator [Deltaproteobacteria bacterium]
MKSTLKTASNTAVRAEQTRLLCRQGSSGSWGNIAAAALLGGALAWPGRNAVPLWVLSPFFVIIAIFIARLILVRRFYRAAPRDDEIAPWEHHFFVTSVLSGFAWGAAWIIVFPKIGGNLRFLLIVLVSGLVAAGIATLGAILRVYLAYMIPNLLGVFIASALWLPEGRLLMLGLLVVFFLVMLRTGRSQEASIVRAIVLAVEKEALLDIVRRRSDALIKANTAAEEAREEALEASRAKSEFLANMSHEVRTPLNGVLGITELLLLDEELSAHQRDYLETIFSSGKVLLSFLNEILDFSKVEAGKLALEKLDFQPGALLFEVVRVHAAQAHQRNNELICDVSSDLDKRFFGDPTRLRQILSNLISNAIKFTKDGEVVVRVQKGKKIGKDIVTLNFSVQDTGIGIPKTEQSHIFESFAQADGSTTRRFGGTGLGLAISSRLVNLMGGDLSLASDPGHGSTFSFEIPLERLEGPRARPPIVQDRLLKGLEILVLDENETHRKILGVHCKTWDMKPTLVDQEQDALDLLHQNPSRFGLILINDRLSEMDCFEFARHLKQMESVSAIPLIIMSSTPRHGDNLRCRNYGIEGYLLKPISANDLHKAMRLVLGQHEDKRDHPRDKNTSDSPQQDLVTRHMIAETAHRVLLVEDNRVNRMVVEKFLMRRGYHVTVAQDGIEALKAFKHNVFDVILMDIQMPRMGGYEATQEIRSIEDKRGSPPTPIIALTAHAMQ